MNIGLFIVQALMHQINCPSFIFKSLMNFLFTSQTKKSFVCPAEKKIKVVQEKKKGDFQHFSSCDKNEVSSQWPHKGLKPLYLGFLQSGKYFVFVSRETLAAK